MTRLLVAGLVTSLFLTGCADEPSPSTSPPAESPQPSSVTETSMAENSGEWDLVLTDVRAARHEDTDRVVMEFEGTGTPGWVVNYVRKPRLEGSGDAAPVDGDHVLQVVASGTTYPTDVQEALGLEHFPAPGADAVSDVFLGGTFEGYTQLFVGVGGERRPFRVTTLTDPARLVVDLG